MRSIGRRKTDRPIRGGWALGAGVLLGVVALGGALVTSYCDRTTTTPTEVVTQAPPPGTVSGGGTVAPPTVVQPDPEPGAAFELTGRAGSCINVKYNGEASRAEIATWYSGFDNQNEQLDKKSAQVNRGDSLDRCFGRPCIQADADAHGWGLHGIFFDKDMNPFVPSRNPEKVTECRTVPCVEPREVREIPGEWSWNDTILDGACEVETYPIGDDAIAPQLNCRIEGTQKITLDFQCINDDERVQALCRNVACPTPEPTPTPSPTPTPTPTPSPTPTPGPQCQIGETGVATGQGNACEAFGLVLDCKIEAEGGDQDCGSLVQNSGSCWTVTWSDAQRAVILKAATQYQVFENTLAGTTTYCNTTIRNDNNVLQNISHLESCVCPGVE